MSIYPKHQYSHYIDQNFSFDNRVYSGPPKMLCNGNIMLEPRLQEYLKKKK